jgi:hypothetical protein
MLQEANEELKLMRGQLEDKEARSQCSKDFFFSDGKAK